MVVAWENSRHFATPLHYWFPRKVASDERTPSTEYGISALASQRSFRRETSVGVAKCRHDCWLVYCMSQSGLVLLQVSSMDPRLRASAIGHFPSPKTPTFKVRPSAQHFLWKRVLFAWERKIISISKAEQLTSFWYRGRGNSEMPHCQWDQVVTVGRAYGHVITKISRMGRLPNFLTHGAPLCVLHARRAPL